MNEISQSFINSIGGKTDTELMITTNYKQYNGEKFATLWIALEMAKELKQSGYNANVLNAKTGEVLFSA